MFSKFTNFVPIDLKIGTHWLDIYYVPCNKFIHENNIGLARYC